MLAVAYRVGVGGQIVLEFTVSSLIYCSLRPREDLMSLSFETDCYSHDCCDLPLCCN